MSIAFFAVAVLFGFAGPATGIGMIWGHPRPSEVIDSTLESSGTGYVVRAELGGSEYIGYQPGSGKIISLVSR